MSIDSSNIARIFSKYDDMHQENANNSTIDKNDSSATSVFTTAQNNIEQNIQQKIQSNQNSGEQSKNIIQQIKQEFMNALNKLSINYTTDEAGAKSADTTFENESNASIESIQTKANEAIKSLEEKEETSATSSSEGVETQDENKTETSKNDRISKINQLKETYNNALQSYNENKDNDGFFEKTANYASAALWNSKNTYKKVEADLSTFSQKLETLETLNRIESPTEADIKRMDTLISELEGMNLGSRVEVFNISQDSGGKAIKTGVVVAGTIAAAAATGGGSLVASAVVAGVTTASLEAGTEILDLATNNVDGDINKESLGEIAENSIKDGVKTGLTVGVLGEAKLALKMVEATPVTQVLQNGLNAYTSKTGKTTKAAYNAYKNYTTALSNIK